MAEPTATLSFSIYTPSEPPLSVQATEVVLPGQEGVLTVMPQHTPLLTALRPGVMIVTSDEGEKHYAVHGGFAEVSRDYVLVLTDSFEMGDDIDTERAHAAQKRAEERLAATSADHDLARAEAALMRAEARLHAHSGEGY
jgi:F-type H+-transporting ATPase subunit epsilon